MDMDIFQEIRELGPERWAKEKAGSVLDVYAYGTWTL